MNDPLSKAKSTGPRVSVVIVAYNCADTLGACLESLAVQTCRDFEVVLVNNASPQGEAAACAARHSFVRLIEAGANLGFAGGVNLGARLAKGQWLALLNPDAFAAPDWLEELLSAARRYDGYRVFTSRQLMDDDPSILDGLGDVMSGPCIPYRGGYLSVDPGDTPLGEVFSPCGGAMMISMDLFLAQGGLDEAFFCYCEDVDLGYRLQLVGERTLLVPSAVIRHVGSASSGGRRSEFAVFHGVRNRFWVLVKNTPLLLLPIVAPLHVLAVAVIACAPEQRKHLSVTWRGFKAGVLGLPAILKSRRKVQAARRVGALSIARAMTWNPADLQGRRAVVRPLRTST